VKNTEELRQALTDWINNPNEFSQMGKRARQVLDSMAGASARTISNLQQLELLP
jgi:3-deoxy-D-manno-octulosonic-acid transferase